MKIQNAIYGKIYEVPSIGNYYGGLCVRLYVDGFQWSIEDYSGHDWHPISDSLAAELLSLIGGQQ